MFFYLSFVPVRRSYKGTFAALAEEVVVVAFQEKISAVGEEFARNLLFFLRLTQTCPCALHPRSLLMVAWPVYSQPHV